MSLRIYKVIQVIKTLIILKGRRLTTLFIACPMCGEPLAYGGPSCKMYSPLSTCCLCQEYNSENPHV